MAHPFYDAQRAAQAQRDRESIAEFRGLCDGLEGKPRENPCVADCQAAWFKGYDAGVVKAALYRLAQPASERVSAARVA